MKQKFDIINKLIEKNKEDKFGPYIYLVHGIYYTIDVNYLIDLFIKTNNLDVKKSLDYHLSKRFKDENINLKYIFNRLLRVIKKLPYKQHQRVRILLAKFVTDLPKPYIQRYFNYFSSTGYSSDISAALKVSNYVWNSEFDNIFIEKYLETCDEKYLDVVLTNGNPESISAYLNELWDDDYLNNYYKNKIIRKLIPEYLDKLDFLKEIEPDKYLYAVSIACNDVTDNDAEVLFKKLDENQKSFGLWCLGKLGKWDLMKQYIEEYLR